MIYYSLNSTSPKTSFKEAVIRGIAPDRGLYFPESIEKLPDEFFDQIEEYSNEEIAYQAIKQFIGHEIPEAVLRNIINETISFDFPTIPITDQIYALELFHGPTLAFKDVGAKFMAKCLEYFNQNNDDEVTVLVATSGDTGGAVANGFLGTKGVNVVILYPSGKVSEIQEKQLTTLGQNILALEVQGNFDDCQDMVKTAFLDHRIQRKLTSANSINVARWMPQMFYYFFAYKQLKKLNKEIVVSVPSGNFGNICAGILAKKLGLPIQQFVASTNSNDTVPQFLKTGNYQPQSSIATISNAMDVSDPSNFVRILELFHKNTEDLKSIFSSFSFDDDLTKSKMKRVYQNWNYTLDPHGAVGYLGLEKHGLKENEIGVVLETAHPIKFLGTVEETLEIKVEIPQSIEELIRKEKKAIQIKNYEELKTLLNRK